MSIASIASKSIPYSYFSPGILCSLRLDGQDLVDAHPSLLEGQRTAVMWLSLTMPYKIDPDVLATVAKEVVGLPLAGGELISRTTQLLAAEYPDLIDPTPGRWVGSKAGGILGKVRFLYFSPREYVVLFGSPTGTQGFSGRYKHVEIHKFLHRRPDRLV